MVIYMFNRNNLKSNKPTSGFTIIEIIVVVTVMGILASIVVIGYGNWRASTNLTQIKSDLSGAAAAMEDARTFDNRYPLTIPTSFSPSGGTTMAGGGSGDGKTYCISATVSGVTYHVDNTNNQPQMNACP